MTFREGPLRTPTAPTHLPEFFSTLPVRACGARRHSCRIFRHLFVLDRGFSSSFIFGFLEIQVPRGNSMSSGDSFHAAVGPWTFLGGLAAGPAPSSSCLFFCGLALLGLDAVCDSSFFSTSDPSLRARHRHYPRRSLLQLFRTNSCISRCAKLQVCSGRFLFAAGRSPGCRGNT